MLIFGRSLDINTERLRQKAHELALTHDPYFKLGAPRRLWREFNKDVMNLRAFIRNLQEKETVCSQPAEEWLLDHADFIEEQVMMIRRQLSGKLLRRLPCLKKAGDLRVLSICADYLEHVDGLFDEDSLVAYINSYQEVLILSIAEVWSIPLVMRIALIRRLAAVMELVRDRRDACELVERMLSGIEPAKLEPELLNQALDQASQDIPLSGPLLVHLISHLREWADDSVTVREWLFCKLENGPDSLEQIVSYEFQLQAAYQVTAGNIIGSMRNISRLQWQEQFEAICTVEQTLRQESAGSYPLLDFSSRDILRRQVEKLARRLGVPENLVAEQAVDLAAKVCEQYDEEHMELDGVLPRQAFVPYYLLEPDGIVQLRKALKTCSSPRYLPENSIAHRATGTYFTLLAGLFFAALAVFSWWIGGNNNLSFGQWIFIIAALLLPASEWAVTIVHWLIGCVKETRPLLRYDFSQGVPPEAMTMVVIPVIWSSVTEVQDIAARLELHYLANRDPNIHFALLGDLCDATAETLPDDDAILDAARSCIEELNEKYASRGGSTFHLFQRRRQWNPSEGVWMGWERKRGILVEFVELLRGRPDTSFSTIIGDSSVLEQIRYIITLDADTQLPLGSAQRMIGNLHLPYNRPRLNRKQTRVVEGYGVLQPHIGISHGASLRSWFAGLWSADPGIDPYAFAVSDPYQDGFGQGIFTGKGIFDVEAFARVLCSRIPDNRVLSHDLLEGGFLRAGLLSDVELIDEHPATFSSYQKRLHRWVRGDWQLLPWLLPRVRDRQGSMQPVDLSVITRWQIIDNLRRSLLPPGLLALLLLGMGLLPGYAERWLAIVLATLFLPVLRQLTFLRWAFWRPRSLLATVGQVLVTIITLPFQSVVLLDAIIRTLYRLLVSKRHLLEWVSAAEVERRHRAGAQLLLGLTGGYLLILLQVFIAASLPAGTPRFIVLVLCALWAAAPFFVYLLDRPAVGKARLLSRDEEGELYKLAGQIWAFFEDYVTASDHWLPPDNVQYEPPNGVARRTSPTNIGLYLACVLAARDFGFIDTPGLVERLERTLATVEELATWHGHLYNWYDTVTLKPLPPQYVSTVDSGNFVGCLIIVKEGLREWLSTEQTGSDQMAAELSMIKRNQAIDVAFAAEIAPDLKQVDKGAGVDWQQRGQRLLNRLETLISGTDFRPLYDRKAKLFSLGYQTGLRETDRIKYDLAASEARLASFIAIALGQVPSSHWHALGRTMTRIGRRVALLSWSGTMFEYLMPWLFMQTYRNTVWDSTYHAVVQRQITYARIRGIPFGISESGYYAFDFRMNYQYRAFGVPGLGFKRGLEQDLVVAPYATFLALPFALRQGLDNLRKLEELGVRGEYGFFEAIDFTRERLPRDCSHVVIKSFMTHHQGMSLLALTNMIAPRKMYERFHQDRRVQSAELLLQERIPPRPQIIKHTAMRNINAYQRPPATTGGVREFVSADTPSPEVCLLSNGTMTSIVTNSGSGVLLQDGLAISRWSEDPVLDNWGSYLYIRDVTHDHVWSPAFQPCRVSSPQQRVQFSLDRATFMRVDGDIHTSLEICVSPEWNAEVRRLTLANTGNESRILEVTSFLELVLTSPDAFDAHQAFSKLFIKTAYVEENNCLLAKRRLRQADEKTLWAAHTMLSTSKNIGPVEYETNRASFIGRGHTMASPQGLQSRLHKTVGSVADPAFVMRQRLSLEPGEQAQLFIITSVAGTREEVLDIVSRFNSELLVERTFQLAWNRSQIELRHLRLTAAEASVFQTLAGRVLYNPPLGKERSLNIKANTKGQSGLWAHGISGDIPILLVRINDRANLPFVVKVITGHEYLRRLGLYFDLVILNESAGGYQQDLQDALQRVLEKGFAGDCDKRTGGNFVINAGNLPEQDKILLLAAARITLLAGGASIRAQTRLKQRKYSRPPVFKATKAIVESVGREPVNANELLFFNGWGGFTPDGKGYQILHKKGNHLPAPWSNVMANPRFGFLVTELGTGYTWWRNSREFKLTPWSNDPVLDQPGELCFIRDEESGAIWLATPSTVKTDRPYVVTHGWGFSRFTHERNGIAQEMTLFVPLDDPVKLGKLRLVNHSGETRRLSVTYYVEWVLGVNRRFNAPFILTEWDDNARVLLARNTYQETFPEACAFLGVLPQTVAACDSAATGELTWTSDRHEFIGRNGELTHPAAMARDFLSSYTGAFYDPCGAVQAKLTLAPGEERSVLLLLGCGENREQALQLAQKYSCPQTVHQSYEAVTRHWEEVLGAVKVNTPFKEMDILLNGWLLYQTLACRIWARAAFYQAGGAYGFRDQLQDALALLHTRPELAREQILLHAAHQYIEGDVQHWWHVETERGIRTLFSDDLLWLPYCVARYVQYTGDDGILSEQVPYLTSEPLKEGEAERYEPTCVSEHSGTVMEHCLLAIDRALQRFGENGLPLIGTGDWNDGMSLVGAKGKGESVWLGWFLYGILKKFVLLCREQGRQDVAELYQAASMQLSISLDKNAWDGQWYRRARTDAGQWLGSIYNEECRIDAIAQSWSVISGAAPRDKALLAMESFERELVDRELNVIRLLAPPFDSTEPSPGYIQGYPPGIRENGAQYTHGTIWSVIAWAKLGQGERALELFQLLNPINHTRTNNEARQYGGEPYVMAADVYTVEPHEGRAGWTWYTGAAGWMYQAGLEWILGIRRRANRLYIAPCIPEDWPGFSVSYRFGRASYHIVVKNAPHSSGRITALQIDGKSVDLTGREKQEGCYIEMKDDGESHEVLLVLS
jgi:cyclic beta-1,2-glucan synthetase